MEKVIKNNFFRFIHYILISSFVCSPFQISSESCFLKTESTEDEEQDFINYEELGDYEDLYRTFEEEIYEYENSEIKPKGFFNWGKKVKKWLKKRTFHILKKLTVLKKNSNLDQCAYTVAKFKRKIDKYYNTGSIETLLDDFDAYLPKDPRIDSFQAFKDKISHYHYNKNARPKYEGHELHNFSVQSKDKNNSEKKKHNELENYPIRAVFGGLEIACGLLIFILPLPGCRYLGSTIAAHGVNNIYEGYMQKFEEEQKDKNKH